MSAVASSGLPARAAPNARAKRRGRRCAAETHTRIGRLPVSVRVPCRRSASIRSFKPQSRCAGHAGESLAVMRAGSLNEHLTHDGEIVFRHACKMGLEGIVSKRLGSIYRSGRSKDCLSSRTRKRRLQSAKPKKTGAKMAMTDGRPEEPGDLLRRSAPLPHRDHMRRYGGRLHFRAVHGDPLGHDGHGPDQPNRDHEDDSDRYAHLHPTALRCLGAFIAFFPLPKREAVHTVRRVRRPWIATTTTSTATRTVSATGLRLPQAELSHKSNLIARRRIRRFESYMPSQAVRSLGGMAGLEKCFRPVRGLKACWDSSRVYHGCGEMNLEAGRLAQLRARVLTLGDLRQTRATPFYAVERGTL
jgi:hypothetical protein